MTESVYVQMSDGREGPYIVTEEHPDGSLVVVPDRSDLKDKRGDHDKDTPPSTPCRLSGRSLPKTGNRMRTEARDPCAAAATRGFVSGHRSASSR
jgi:hypothetical protein